ncbi:MAG: glycoside hydrolase family 19 protein [Polaribacter sp.]|uniref:glycoside hydrolase family 19 protein n=1 Tax=Polaribacter sp. TaxID=1920175 RepID=UPI002F35DEA5
MKNRKSNFIKLGIFLFGISFLLFNCEKEELEIIDVEAKKELNIKTVTPEKAKIIFENYLKNKPNIFARGESDELTLDPQWETTAQDSLSFTEALLTNTQTIINREGNYTSKIFFLEVNDSINKGVYTEWIDEPFENGIIKNGKIYFNDFDGKFLDAYNVVDGLITHKLVLREQVQQASMFSFMFYFYQDTIAPDPDCWNTDNLPFDGVFDGIEITVSTDGGSSSGGGGTNSAGQNAYYLFLGDSDSYDDENSDTESNNNNGGSNGGSNTANCTGGKVENPTTNQCECPEGKVEDSSGNCIDNPCTDGVKTYNKETGKCDCPTGKVEDNDGNCVDKCETTKEDLKKVFTTTTDAKLKEIADAINKYGKDFEIDTKDKLRHFLSQAGHESGKFKTFEENLNYRWKKLGINDFKKYFNPHTDGKKDTLKANPNDYKRNSTSVYVNKEKMGNLVYGGRMGNDKSGDGYKYRGRGIIQLTGENNYQSFTNFYQNKYDASKDFIANPDLVKTDMKIATISALWFFKNNVIDKITINDKTIVKTVTKKVNGGTNGLTDRKELHKKVKENIDCK